VTTVEQTRLDVVYQEQRRRLALAVGAGVSAAWTNDNRNATLAAVIRIVTAGTQNTARLVDAYMAAKTVEKTGRRLDARLDPAVYTPSALRRGIDAAAVYSRPFGAYGAFAKDGAHPDDALRAARASLTKLAATDMQLAQTHAARDWMQQAADATAGTDGLRIVGYRRVLNGPGPHCALCTAAATRTYRVSDLMPIHEHCGCGVQALYGTEPVASVGTTVRVEDDAEIGPRLVADSWTATGPRLIEYEEQAA
jgi:hypothetical protein